MPRPGAVVLGGGAAGLRAAITLRDAGLPVQVLVKGAAGPSGATPSALFSYCCGQPGDPANPPELFYDDVMRAGHGINDPALVSLLRDAYPRLLELTGMGMPWTLTPDGDYERVGLPGHHAQPRFPRGTAHRQSPFGCPHALRARPRRLLPPVRPRPRPVVRRAHRRGLAVLDLRTGQATAWPCGAVIVATGGARPSTGSTRTRRARPGTAWPWCCAPGASCWTWSSCRCTPVLVHPPGAYGMEIATGRILSAGTRLVNRDGAGVVRALGGRDRWQGNA